MIRLTTRCARTVRTGRRGSAWDRGPDHRGMDRGPERAPPPPDFPPKPPTGADGDHFEAAALKDEFDAAVEHLTQLTMASTTLDGPELTEAVERRLFSLHARVTRGVPPAEPPAKADEAEQWAAWDETRAMSAEAAREEAIK